MSTIFRFFFILRRRKAPRKAKISLKKEKNFRHRFRCRRFKKLSSFLLLCCLSNEVSSCNGLNVHHEVYQKKIQSQRWMANFFTIIRVWTLAKSCRVITVRRNYLLSPQWTSSCEKRSKQGCGAQPWPRAPLRTPLTGSPLMSPKKTSPPPSADDFRGGQKVFESKEDRRTSFRKNFFSYVGHKNFYLVCLLCFCPHLVWWSDLH